MYPELPDIAQRAVNAKFSTQQGQDCFQMFARARMVLNGKVAKEVSDPVSYVVKDLKK